jgi:ABC-type Na+ efflux pump permease subunit
LSRWRTKQRLATTLTSENPVRVQEALVEFYRIVMSMLVALIALIAPALTANAITLERERKTMDLLLATPLTARQFAGGQAAWLVRVYRCCCLR